MIWFLALTFQKSCLHILDVSCVNEIEQGFSQKTARRVSQHISQPGWHFHTLKIMIKWLSYQESTSKNFISREWRVVKTPSWLGAENTGLTGLAVPTKRDPDNPESWLASPRVCPVIRRGLYDACGVRIQQLRITRVRVAEVAREHGWHPPKSLDSDENFKPEHTLFFRELRFVAIYALFFGDLWA